jgi:hypothetical protein
MLSKIVNYAIGSGLVTSTCSLSTIIVVRDHLFRFALLYANRHQYKLLPQTLIYVGLEFILTKLYIISFLAMYEHFYYYLK